MHPIKLIFPIVIFLLGIIGFSIYLAYNYKIMVPSDKHKKIAFNPEKGFLYKYLINTGRVIDQKMLGKRIQSRDSSVINLSFNVLKDSFQGNSGIAVNLDSISTTGRSQIFDDILLPNDPDTESEKVIKGLKGTSFFLKVSGTGQLIDIKSNEEIKEEISKSNNSEFSALTGKDAYFLKQSYLINLVKKKMFILPDIAINLNSSWKQPDSVGLLPVKFINLYHVYDIKNGLIFVKVQSDIDQNILVNNQLPVHVTGNQEGEIILEEKSGMLLKNNSKLNLLCSIERNGVTILQDVLVTINIERTD